jgi:hypothetical protein
VHVPLKRRLTTDYTALYPRRQNSFATTAVKASSRVRLTLFQNLNCWVMHPVARVSVNIYRNLRTQQMSVFVLLCTSYTTCFGPYWWPESENELYRLSDCRLSAMLEPTFADRGVPRGQRDGPLRPYSRFSRPEPLLFLPSSSSAVLTRLGGPRSRPTTSQKIW